MTLPYVRGVDWNRYRGAADLSALRAQGYEFVVARITVGNYYTDPTWRDIYAQAESIGMPFSGYHVVIPNNTVNSQMQRFLGEIDGIVPELPWVMDSEVIASQSPATITAVNRGCISQTPLVRGFKPLIYTNRNYGQNYLLDTFGCELWIADPDPQLTPDIPTKWKDWRFWQYSWTGSPEGVETPPVDLDYGHFTNIDELKIYYGVIPPPPTLEERVTSLEQRVSILEIKVP